MQLSFRTYSLWSFINQPENMKSFINILYEPNNEPIWPNISPFSLDLWSNLYLRYQLDQTALEEAKSEIIKLKEKEIELKSKAIKLRK
jgi:myotubularin-related protein 9